MNPLFLLKLMADLLSDQKPTTEKIDCVKKILDTMIKDYDRPVETGNPLPTSEGSSIPAGVLDPEAEQARRELL